VKSRVVVCCVNNVDLVSFRVHVLAGWHWSSSVVLACQDRSCLLQYP